MEIAYFCRPLFNLFQKIFERLKAGLRRLKGPQGSEVVGCISYGDLLGAFQGRIAIYRVV